MLVLILPRLFISKNRRCAIYMYICPSFCLFICLSVCIYLSISLFVNCLANMESLSLFFLTQTLIRPYLTVSLTLIVFGGEGRLNRPCLFQGSTIFFYMHLDCNINMFFLQKNYFVLAISWRQ